MKNVKRSALVALIVGLVACGSQVVEFPECDCPVDTTPPPNSVAPPGDSDSGQPPVDEDAGPPPPSCGDQLCNGEETCSTCPSDCGSCPPPPPVCGDEKCNGQETCSTCAQDCGECPPPPPSCGDGTCNGEETCSSCPADCGQCPPPPPACGDQLCNGEETCSSCPGDCGSCPPPPPSCGDGTCNGQETCSTCSKDCGECPPPPPEDECHKGPDKCGSAHGCCVSDCTHECNKGGKKFNTLTCGKYQSCFKECKAQCDKTFVECKCDEHGPGWKK